MAWARWGLGLAGALLLAAVIGRAADEPRPAAGTVVLSQKEYQDLLDRLARLEGPAKAEAPSTCKVSGRVTGDLAHLRVEFGFRTGQRKARVALGCTQGYPTDARIDGHPPLLRWGADGLSVQVEETGDHQLVLEMDLPLAAREKGAERGLDLDLPAAPVTTLELELPAGVAKALVRAALRGDAMPAKPAAQEYKAEAAGGGPGRLETPGLGPVERLEVTWEGQAPADGPPVLNVSAARVVVRVDERNVAAHAELTVGLRRGRVKELQLLVPPQAVIRGPDGDERVLGIDAPKSPGGPHTVRLRPTADPISLSIDVLHARSGGSVPVGPFVVRDAFPQSGDIVISAPAGVTLDYQPRGESQYLLTQREPTEDEKKQFPNLLALHYSTLPGVEKAAPQPFLGLQAERPRGVLEARASHTLRLVRGDGGAPAAWRLTTTLDAQAYHAEVEKLLVRLPPGYTFDERAGPKPAAGVQAGEIDPAGRTLPLLLTPRKGSISVTFEGQYAALPGSERLDVALPELEGKPIDLGARVAVVLPPDLELVPPHPGSLWDAGKADGPNKRTWTFERRPERLEIAWQPYRPELIVNGEARVTLVGRQATVNQRLWLRPGQTGAPEQLTLSVPAEVIGLAISGGGDAAPRLEGKEGGPRTVQVAAPADREHALVLDYAFRLPEPAADSFPVPLVGARAATGGETRVCVWSDPGTRPELKDGRWEVRPTEEVKDKGSYPSLVLLSRQPGTPLALGLGEAAGVGLAAFRVERALIQATVGDGGQQSYRARFLLTQLAAPYVDVELPAPLFRPNPPDVTVLFGGKAATWKPVDDAGKEAAVSRVARVQVPAEAAGKPAVLEVDYNLLPGRVVLQTVLQPPQLRGDPGAAPVRWQVVLPPSWVPLSQDVIGPEYAWAWRGRLLALRPTVATADFERWFAGSEGPRADEARPYPDPAVTVWRSAPEALRLSHVPQQGWLLVCSLTLLIVGLGLAFLSLPRAVFWGTLAVIGVAALVAGLFWPGVLGAVLYGCQPGALVLLPVLGVQWFLHRRYRRQVVFLPSFTRVKAGSSLVRGGSSRTRGEPSTVDHPPPVAAESASKRPQADGNAG